MTTKFVDARDLIRNRHFVGYQKGSLVRKLLVRQLNFNESRLIPYGSPEDYHEALSKGSENGGVELFLDRYCNKYKMVGPTYKTDRLAFIKPRTNMDNFHQAFPLRSPLISYISRAILRATHDKAKMDAIEGRNFRGQSSCQEQDATIFSDNLTLSVYSFGELFIITGFVLVSSVLIYVVLFFQSNWPSSRAIHPSDRSLWSEFLETANFFFRERRLIGFLWKIGSRTATMSQFRSTEASVNNDVGVIARTPNEGEKPVLIIPV
ncbi:glutamate receptor 2.8-like [Rhodamnia argentea]|uniref:Glutamate receptor 2.8-like n=1 Tax=Rhodamnia argentea TaxID=178133 RepID=A0ABM3HBG1_9MYRT|nr:glutamate receptor 2.8-like [Rhodamnia argentea]